MNKQQTPLAKSIQRKKKRIELLAVSLLRPSITDQEYYDAKKESEILYREITEDEKLLPEERERIILDHIKGQRDQGKINKGWAEDHFDTHYTQETNI